MGLERIFVIVHWVTWQCNAMQQNVIVQSQVISLCKHMEHKSIKGYHKPSQRKWKNMRFFLAFSLDSCNFFSVNVLMTKVWGMSRVRCRLLTTIIINHPNIALLIRQYHKTEIWKLSSAAQSAHITVSTTLTLTPGNVGSHSQVMYLKRL